MAVFTSKSYMVMLQQRVQVVSLDGLVLSYPN